MRTVEESLSKRKEDVRRREREDFDRRHDLRAHLLAPTQRNAFGNPQANKTQSQQTATPEPASVADAVNSHARSDSVARDKTVSALSTPASSTPAQDQDLVWAGRDSALTTSGYVDDSEDVFSLFTTLNDDEDDTPIAANKAQAKPTVAENQDTHCDVCRQPFPICQCRNILRRMTKDHSDRRKTWARNEAEKIPDPPGFRVPIDHIMSDESMRRTWHTSDLEVQMTGDMQREATNLSRAARVEENPAYTQKQRDQLTSTLPGRDRDLLRSVRGGGIQKDAEEVVFRRQKAQSDAQKEQEELEKRAFKPGANRNVTLSKPLTIDPKLLQTMNPRLP